MLRSAGFEIQERAEEEVYVCRRVARRGCGGRNAVRP
jgi:hypothetical protein